MILQFLFQLLILLLSRPIKSMASSPPSLLTKPNCPATCGNNVAIPFPFGVGATCYFEEWYAVYCKSNKPFLNSVNLEVLEFSLGKSTIRVNQPVISSCQNSTAEVSLIIPESFPFYFSYDYNSFFGVGCNNRALMSCADVENYTLGGCFSNCYPRKKNTEDDKYCGNGIECCTGRFPPALKRLNISVGSINKETRSRSQQLDCKYAFLVDSDWYDDNFNSSKDVQNWVQVPVAFDWRIFNSSYNMLEINKSLTFECKFDVNGLMRCDCRKGYQGNPYLVQGCQDVNECESGGPDICKSDMVCKNSIGSYKCIPIKKSKPFVIILYIGAGIGVLLFIIGAWRVSIIIIKRMKKKEENFKRNGGLLLQQQLNSFEGSVDRCKIFNSNELDKATDHFNVNRILGQGGQGTVYKGMLADGRIIAVKKSQVLNEGKLQEFINEVVILSQINHRNVVMLLGCCLETDVPLLVYEFIPNGTLFQYLHDQNRELPFTWDIRLRIATEVAEALSYLHSGAYSPIYHRDVKSTNILLDEKYMAKIADFGTSRSIAINQTHVSTNVKGTFGYLDPEYFQSSQFTDKSDVYSFGVVLVELLTGQKAVSSTYAEEGKNLATYFMILMEENRLHDVLDDQVRKSENRGEITEVAEFAKRCLNPIGTKRPTMKEVAMELERVRVRALEKGNNVEKYCEEVNNLRTEVINFWDIITTSTSSTLEDIPLSEESWD